MKKTSLTHPLRVDFLSTDDLPVKGRLGMTFAPGKKQSNAMTGAWERDLCTDLNQLKNQFAADVLVSLIEDRELEELMIESLSDECRNAKIEIIRFPIRDVSVPASIEKFAELVVNINQKLINGETVVVHCKGGLGRTGLLAAAILVAATNLDAEAAIKAVRRARVNTVETIEQELFVKQFEEFWKLKIAQK